MVVFECGVSLVTFIVLEQSIMRAFRIWVQNVLGGIFDIRLVLVLIHWKSLNAPYFLVNILQDHIIPWTPFTGNHLHLLDRNAHPHIEKMLEIDQALSI